jgi:hypothetical protein
MTIGLTMVARRAGIQHASIATSASSSAVEPNANGSKEDIFFHHFLIA